MPRTPPGAGSPGAPSPLTPPPAAGAAAVEDPRAARRPRRPHRSRRTAGLVLLGLGLALVALLVWGALSALAVREHATAAAGLVEEVQTALELDDLDGALAGTRAAAEETSRAHDAASALPLRLGSHLPGRAGHLLADLRTVVAATDLAVGDGALPLVEVVAAVRDTSGLLREDGSVDTELLQGAAEDVVPAARSLQEAQRELASVDAGSLPGPVRAPVRRAQEGVDALAGRASSAGSALSVLPAALGAEGPRSYLVAFQNPAEVRPTGGIVGTWALVTVEDGRTQLQGTGSNDDLEALTTPVRDLGAEYAALYPAEQVANSQNVNLSPHFPHAGLLLSDLWVAQGRPAPDGVVAVDPQGMAPLLEGAGEVAVQGGPSVSADTVVDVLLRQAYEAFATDNAGRKEYLSAVVGTAFADALGGGALRPDTLTGLVAAAERGHVVAWSPREDEQAALERARMAGVLPEPTPDAAAVYLTNIAASKLDYYLSEDVSSAPACGDAPPRLTVRLSSDAPARVPEYVANKLDGVDATTESLLVALYLPPQRGISQVRVDGRPVQLAAGSERGWSVARFTVEVPRKAQVEVVADLTGEQSALTELGTQALVRPATTSTASC